MSRSPIFRRVTLTEVKKTTNRRGSLLKELAGLEKEEKDIIKNHYDPSYSNWRASFIIEDGMNTKGFMQQTFPAAGDTDFDSIDSTGDIEQFPNMTSNRDPAGPEGGNWPVQGVEILSSGSGSGDSGGFDIGTDYLAVNNAGGPLFNAINLDPIDCTKLDEIVITGIRGSGSNGGELPTDLFSSLGLIWQSPETIGDSGFPTWANMYNDASLNQVPEGTINEVYNEYNVLIPSSGSSKYDASHTGLREWTLPIPSWVRGENITFGLEQTIEGGLNYGITKIAFRRKSPISVFVSLDSPEAASFMRIGSPSKATDSKKKRERQLREQLEASKDYTDKKFGENFPGSEYSAPGEEDPTEVEKKAPRLGEFEPEVVDYNTWKQETKAEDPQAKTTEKEFEKWKDEKALKAFAAVRDAQQGGVLPSPPSPPTPPVDAQDTKSFDTFQKVSDLHATPGVSDAEKEVGARIAEKEPEEIKAALKDMEKALDKDKFYEPKREDFPPGLEGTKEWRKAKNEDAFASVAQQIGSAGKVYINYLLGNLKDGAINNQFLGQEYVNSLIKNIDISKNQGMIPYIPPGYGSDQLSYIFVGGDNVIGSGGTPTYDPKTGIVTFPFNYDFDTNLEQIIKEPDKYDFNTDDSLSIIDRIKQSDSKQIGAFLGMFAAWVVGGKYALDSIPVPGAGYATWLAKLLGKGQATSGHEVTMSLDDIKKLNPEFAAQLKSYGILNPPGEWEGTQEQQTQLYDDINDLYDTDPDQFDEFIEKVNTNPEWMKVETEAREAREKFEADKKVASKELGAARTKQMDLMKYSWSGSKDYKGTLSQYANGTVDKATAQEIAKLGGVDLGKLDKLIADYDLKTPISWSNNKTWAENQPEYKEAATAAKDAKKAQDAAYKPYKKALEAAAAFEKSLPRHPTKKGHVTGTPSQLAELNRLGAAVAPLKSAYEKAESTAFNTQQAEAKLRNDLIYKRYDASSERYDISSKAQKNIKKLYDEANAEADRLNALAIAQYKPDPKLMQRRIDTWDKAAYDALNPQLTQVSDTSLHGTKIASAIKDKLIKSIEDAAKKGDTEGVEKGLEKLKDYNEKEKKESGAGFDVNIDDFQYTPQTSGLPDGTKIAATYGKGSKKKDWESDFYKQIKDFEQNPAQDPFSRKGTGMGDRWKGSKVPQQDFGSFSDLYGGQGVDAATLASVASQTQTKKKKKKIASSYKPKGSMITEKRKLKSPNDWFNPDDIKPEYPKDPPPEMVNNYHPDLVDSAKKAERFNKLDPASAKAMPKQDDPNIDAKVEKAKNNPDKDGPGWHKQVSDKIRMARAQQRKG